tara:strand:+ start:289 stop:1245 length:957 start_codon:yes stop_codon:yes gene_type:complete
MDFKNVNLKDYCFNLDLHKSMFFIDMLKGTHEFTLKGDEIEIFKKLKNGISEPITRKELIYFIQVEMVEKYEYSSFNKQTLCKVAHAGNFAQRCDTFQGFRDPSKEKTEERKLRVHQSNVKLLIIMFYHLFGDVDSIHKTIDNMVYLEKNLKRQPVIVPKQPPQKIIVESAPLKKPECGGWEEDEEGGDEVSGEESTDKEEINEPNELEKKVNDLEKIVHYLGQGIMRCEGPYIRPINLPRGISLTGPREEYWKQIVDYITPHLHTDQEESDEEESSDEEEEVNELGENKKLVLKNALEKECLSARTELFRPPWRPPR